MCNHEERDLCYDKICSHTQRTHCWGINIDYISQESSGGNDFSSLIRDKKEDKRGKTEFCERENWMKKE